MSNTEINLTDKALADKSKMLKALSNPHRLRIFLALSGCMEPGCVLEEDSDAFENCQRDFASDLGLAPSTISHHFKELRTAGVLHMERQGKTVRFWVDSEAVRELRALFGG